MNYETLFFFFLQLDTKKMARVQQAAPPFSLDAVMPDGSFEQIKLSQFRGKYLVLFFYPLDFVSD
jgi:alkyl hydroperoxide reductase subunit AhpC